MKHTLFIYFLSILILKYTSVFVQNDIRVIKMAADRINELVWRLT